MLRIPQTPQKKVFISSTCADLVDVRAILKESLESLGYVAYTSETPGFPVDPKVHPLDNCLKVVAQSDIYLLVINTRYGSRFDGHSRLPNLPDPLPGNYLSVTLAEFLVASANKKDIRVWVRDSIWESDPIFRASAASASPPIVPTGVDPSIYDFLKYLRDRPGGIWLQKFRAITDLRDQVVQWLRDQAAETTLEFTRTVADTFHLLGYRFSREDFLTCDGRAIANVPNDPFDREYGLWIHHSLASGPVRLAEVSDTIRRMEDDLAAGLYEHAILVANAGFSIDVRDRIGSGRRKKQILLRSHEELLGDLVDFRPYLERIVEDFEHFDAYCGDEAQRDPIIAIMRRANLYKYYVQLNGHSDPRTAFPHDGSAEVYINQWLEDDNRNHLTLLGDFGTGKSSLALWLTYRQARQVIDGMPRVRIPVFISLRDHAGKVDAREIITNTLTNTYGIHLHFPSLLRLSDSGRLLFIFDGFDETATKTDRANTLKILRELNTLVRRNSKVILTCRTHYFRSQDEMVSAIEKSFDRMDTELFVEQKGRRNFEVFYLHEFRRVQVQEFLTKHYDGNEDMARQTLAKMNATYNLRDLYRRPVMLEMILKVWPRLLRRSKGAVDITPAVLYSEYVEEWLGHVAKGNEDVLDSCTKRRFCEDLTRWMYLDNREVVPFSQLEQVVRDFFRDRPAAYHAALDTEVRTCSFLNRDSIGNYQFAHRSFMEFFVALACARELQNEKYELLKHRPLSGEILNFLRNLVSDNAACWRGIQSTRGLSPDSAGFTGGNSATLLRLLGQSFRGRDLSCVVLSDADFTNTDLSDVKFEGACLRGATLTNCTLARTDVRDADLTEVQIGEMGAALCLRWSPDGTHLAIGGSDHNIRVWNVNSGRQVATLRGHAADVRDLRFDATGERLVSAAGDSVIVWRPGTSAVLAQLEFGRGDTVNGFRLAGDRTFPRIVGFDEQIALLNFPQKVFYSHSLRFTIQVDDACLVVRDWKNDGKPCFSSPPQQSTFLCAQYSPDDAALAAGTCNGKVYVWDTSTSDLVALLEEKPVDCRGMMLAGARGLAATGFLVKALTAAAPPQKSNKDVKQSAADEVGVRVGTIGEWFVERGAILEDRRRQRLG